MSYLNGQSNVVVTPVVVTPPAGGIVYAGQPAATFSDFDPISGVWLPIKSAFANQTSTYLAGGAMRVTSNIAHTVDRQQRQGIRSRFKLFPDLTTGILSFSLKMTNGTFTAKAAAIAAMGMGIEGLSTNALEDILLGARISTTLHATSILYATQSLAGLTTVISNTDVVPAGDGFAQLAIRANFAFEAGIGGNDDLVLASFDWSDDDGLNWNNIIPAARLSWFWKYTYGMSIFLGLIGSTNEVYQADFTEFKLLDGFAAMI